MARFGPGDLHESARRSIPIRNLNHGIEQDSVRKKIFRTELGLAGFKFVSYGLYKVNITIEIYDSLNSLS